MTDATGTVGDYALGDSIAERVRLSEQARRLQRGSQRFLGKAGIRAGMRVLELGAGLGDFTRLIAHRVGPQGEVVALERSPMMLAQARAALAEQAVANCRVVQCDLNGPFPHFEGPFDALTGRLVLTHLADPAATLRRALEHVRPGGVVAFQEADFTLSDYLVSRHREQLPLIYQVCQWIALGRAGTTMNSQMGLDLYRVFKQAGLAAPTIRFHTTLYGGACAARIRSTVAFLRNLLPRLEALGICGADIGVDTLEERMTAETAATDVVQAFATIASAWAVKNSS